jgi:hypothetical protein
MTTNNEPIDIQDLAELLKNDPKWRQLSSPISSCINKRNRLALKINLVLTMSIMLNLLLQYVELIGTPLDAIPEGTLGIISMPVTISSMLLAFTMICVAISVFISHLKFSLCHSIGMQMVIRQMGTDSPEFTDIYRKSAIEPLVKATASRLLLVLASVTSILTPIVIRQYSGVTFTDVVDLLVIINLGIALLCGGMISEWAIKRTYERYRKMSDLELKDDAELLVSKTHEKTLRWIRSQVRVKSSGNYDDGELEPLIELWYDDYLYRDANMDNHKHLLESLTRIENVKASLILLAIGLFCTITWLVSSTIITLIHLPAPSI